MSRTSPSTQITQPPWPPRNKKSGSGEWGMGNGKRHTFSPLPTPHSPLPLFSEEVTHAEHSSTAGHRTERRPPRDGDIRRDRRPDEAQTLHRPLQPRQERPARALLRGVLDAP